MATLLAIVGSKAKGASGPGPGGFINRELSWLEFNQRVLDEALDPSNPLLERLKFFCIVASNLDEFFEVRVAGVKQQMESDIVERSPDGLTASELFRAMVHRIRQMVSDQYACWRNELLPALRENGIRVLRFSELEQSDLAWLQQYYMAQVRPVLTPLAIDPAHPFPQLLNKSLNLIVRLEIAREHELIKHLAVVQIPRILPRMVKLPGEGRLDYVYLGQLVGHNLANLFPGTIILGHWAFRVTRNSELYIDEEETANLLKAVENELHNRRKGDAVRLEIDHDVPENVKNALLKTLNLTEEDLYLLDGPINPTRLMSLYEGDHSPELRDKPFVAPLPAALKHDPDDIFAKIRQGDILLHHPYENFSSVVDFLVQAAKDPDVLAIKQTLYRTGGDPRIIGTLEDAVNNGKQVTAVVELRARFDEANNIEWARRLEESGVHVVYGLVGYKIHAKALLVVRREGHLIRRYVHFSTGNYNPTTARVYTDLGLLTCRPEFGEDATNFFNLLTGICQFQPMRKLVVAPFELHNRILQLIERERENAERGLPARIIARLNSLAETKIIEALYRASQSGVQIDMVVRGICCLRPGVPGLSDNIRVRSIVDRFLEHSRVYYFENACQPEVFLSSADWLPRNFFRRIELAIPILDGRLRERLMKEILPIPLQDNVKARVLQADGSYVRLPRQPGEPEHRSQSEFVNLSEEPAGSTIESSHTAEGYPKVKPAPRPEVLSGKRALRKAGVGKS